jgi:hypothetical protein
MYSLIEKKTGKKSEKENEHSEKQLLHVCIHWARKRKGTYSHKIIKKRKKYDNKANACLASRK